MWKLTNPDRSSLCKVNWRAQSSHEPLLGDDPTIVFNMKLYNAVFLFYRVFMVFWVKLRRLNTVSTSITLSSPTSQVKHAHFLLSLQTAFPEDTEEAVVELPTLPPSPSFAVTPSFAAHENGTVGLKFFVHSWAGDGRGQARHVLVLY